MSANVQPAHEALSEAREWARERPKAKLHYAPGSILVLSIGLGEARAHVDFVENPLLEVGQAIFEPPAGEAR